MPRNPNGEYVLPSIYQAFSGQLIRADQHNIPLVDIAQALTGSVARNGSTPMNGNLPMGGNRVTGLAPATADSDAARLDQVTKYSGFLNAVSNLTFVANEFPYATGASTAGKTALTPYARSILASASDVAMRTVLGLGNVATQNVVPINMGGTGAGSASAARLNLGLNSGAEMAIATQAEANAGALNNVIMTPLRTDGVIQSKVLGWGQSWVDVTASRVAGTAYRNTTGRPIIVSVTADASANNQGLRVSTDGTNYVPVGYFPNSGGASCCIQAVVAHNEYYRVDTSLDGLLIWAERR